MILHGTVTVDDLTFVGSLDRVVGRLDVHAGSGSNTLSVSDRDDPDADGARRHHATRSPASRPG